MEFLKHIFEDEALTYGQFAERMKGAGRDGVDMKLADLSQGGYVGAEKHRAAVAERNDLREKVAGLADAEALKAESEAWRAKAEVALADADRALKDAEYRAAVGEACRGLEFSSPSARSAFVAAVREAQLPLGDGVLEGFDGFAATWRERDPAAFVENGPLPRFTAGSLPPVAEENWRDKAARNYLKARSNE